MNIPNNGPPSSHAWQLSSDPAWLQLEQVHAWLAASYWSPNIRLDVVKKAFENSQFVGAYDEHRAQLGVARAVTDGATFGWLCDVYVVERARSLGIASAMCKSLMNDPRNVTLRRWCLATRDAHELYRPLGFVEPAAGRFMEFRSPPATWSADTTR
jgi:GNAT superfamily N-acetyltransferase